MVRLAAIHEIRQSHDHRGRHGRRVVVVDHAFLQIGQGNARMGGVVGVQIHIVNALIVNRAIDHAVAVDREIAGDGTDSHGTAGRCQQRG